MPNSTGSGITRTEAAADQVTNAAEALRRVLAIESSEINHVFRAVVGASDTGFVRRLTIFRKTGQEHVRFIAESVARIEPSPVPDRQKRLEAHPETTAP